MLITKNFIKLPLRLGEFSNHSNKVEKNRVFLSKCYHFNKEAFMASDLIQLVADDTFASATATGVVLVDFYADWCGPCRMLSPVLERLAKDIQGKAKIVKVDTDKAEKTAASFRITSIPTLILFKDGKEIERVVGLRDEQALKAMISKAL
jgi:thioredoxin 1